MDKLTTALIAAAVGLGLLAARNARGSQPDAQTDAQASPAPPSPTSQANLRQADQGMVVMRNDPLDNDMVVHSPFDGDRGIVRQ